MAVVEAVDMAVMAAVGDVSENLNDLRLCLRWNRIIMQGAFTQGTPAFFCVE